jgi:hypothetical protein
MERSNPSGNCKASGNLGKPILQALLDSSDFSVSVLIRKSSDAVFPPGVLVHKTDFSKLSFLSAFEGQYAIVSAVGAGGFLD